MFTHGVLLLCLVARIACADIEGVCRSVSEVFRIITGDIHSVKFPESCKLAYGLGFDVLTKNSSIFSPCFAPIYDRICSMRFIEKSFEPTCQSTLLLFRRIVQEGNVEFGANNEILDPASFCEKSFVLTKGGAKDNVSPRPQRFQADEVENCKSIAESYNACISISSLANSPIGDSCLYRFKYCELASQMDVGSKKIVDEEYKKYCRNVVAPAILMDSLLVDSYRRSGCSDFTNYEQYLERIYISLQNSVRELEDSADSLVAVSKWRGEEIANRRDMDDILELINEAFNKLRILDSQQLAFDAAVIDEFNKIMKLLEKNEERSAMFSANLLLNIVVYHKIKGSFSIIATHLTSIKNFTEHGHVSFTNAYGFQSLSADLIENVRGRFIQLFENCRYYITQSGEDGSYDSELVAELRNRAIELKNVYEQYEEQINILKKYKQGDIDKESSFSSTLARLSKLATASS